MNLIDHSARVRTKLADNVIDHEHPTRRRDSVTGTVEAWFPVPVVDSSRVGIGYRVRHDDGTAASYAMHEIEVLPVIPKELEDGPR